MQNVEQDINREVRVQEMEDMILRAMDKRQKDANGQNAGIDVRQWAEQTLNEHERQKEEALSAERQVKLSRDALMNSGMINLSAVDATLAQVSKDRQTMDKMMKELGGQGGIAPQVANATNDLAARQVLVTERLDELAPFMAKHKGVYLQRLMKSCGIDFPEAALVEIEKATEGFIVKYTEQDLQTAANRVLGELRYGAGDEPV